MRLDFLRFSLAMGEQGDCPTDWMTVIGADGGREKTKSVCGEKSGLASKYEKTLRDLDLWLILQCC